jgi:hypothetical protein
LTIFEMASTVTCIWMGLHITKQQQSMQRHELPRSR